MSLWMGCFEGGLITHQKITYLTLSSKKYPLQINLTSKAESTLKAIMNFQTISGIALHCYNGHYFSKKARRNMGLPYS